MPNITIDDWNSTLIVYNPPDCNGAGWKLHTGKGAYGSYRSCTSLDVPPSARISFTGVAAYYESAYFDGGSIIFRLDGISSGDVPIAPLPGQNPNATKVFWSTQNLENTEHTLELFPGNNGTTLNVDSFLFTTSDVPANVTSTPKLTPPPKAGTQTGIVKNSSIIGTVLGAVIGGIAGLIFIAVLYTMCRRKQQLRKDRVINDGLTPPSFSDPHVDTGFPGGDAAHTHMEEIKHISPPVSPRLPDPSTQPPVRPLPSIPPPIRETRDYSQHPYSSASPDPRYMDNVQEERRKFSSPVPSTSTAGGPHRQPSLSAMSVGGHEESYNSQASTSVLRKVASLGHGESSPSAWKSSVIGGYGESSPSAWKQSSSVGHGDPSPSAWRQGSSVGHGEPSPSAWRQSSSVGHGDYSVSLSRQSSATSSNGPNKLQPLRRGSVAGARF